VDWRAERPDCCLLSCRGPQGGTYGRREMGPHATVRQCFGTADRSEHDAAGNVDHRQRSSSARATGFSRRMLL